MRKGTHLYEWQEQCLSLWFAGGCRGIASVATGAGKTLFALVAAERLKSRVASAAGRDLNVKIVVPRVFLSKQWRGEIVRTLDVPEREVGLYCGALKSDPSLPYMIYVINSARYNISRHIMADVESGKDVLLICDEAHHCGSTENARIFEFMKRTPRGRVRTLGLSATPDAEHMDDVIIPALGPIFYRFHVGDAIRRNIAAPYVSFRVAIGFTQEEREEYDNFSAAISRAMGKLHRLLGKNHPAGEAELPGQLNALIAAGGIPGDLAWALRDLLLRRKSVLLLAKSRVDCSIELVKDLFEGNKIILFSERIATADALHKGLSELYPSRVGLYHSGMDPDVKGRALEAYRTGRVSVIVSCRSLDEGLNVPDTDIGVIVSSGTGLRRRIQRVGRVIRKTGREKPKRIFYLYIPGTSESGDLLPQDHIDTAYAGAPSISLAFDSGTNRVVNPPYDQIAERVISDLTAYGATKKQIENASKQIRRGALATDWLLPESEVLALLNRAGPGERPYLSTMLLMVRAAADMSDVNQSEETTVCG